MGAISWGIVILALLGLGQCESVRKQRDSYDDWHAGDFGKKSVGQNRISERDSYDEWHAGDFGKKSVTKDQTNDKREETHHLQDKSTLKQMMKRLAEELESRSKKDTSVHHLTGKDIAQSDMLPDKRAYAHGRRPPTKKDIDIAQSDMLPDKRAYGHGRRPPTKKDIDIAQSDMLPDKRAYGHGRRPPTKKDTDIAQSDLLPDKRAYGHQQRPQTGKRAYGHPNRPPTKKNTAETNEMDAKKRFYGNPHGPEAKAVDNTDENGQLRAVGPNRVVDHAKRDSHSSEDYSSHAGDYSNYDYSHEGSSKRDEGINTNTKKSAEDNPNVKRTEVKTGVLRAVGSNEARRAPDSSEDYSADAGDYSNYDNSHGGSSKRDEGINTNTKKSAEHNVKRSEVKTSQLRAVGPEQVMADAKRTSDPSQNNPPAPPSMSSEENGPPSSYGPPSSEEYDDYGPPAPMCDSTGCPPSWKRDEGINTQSKKSSEDKSSVKRASQERGQVKKAVNKEQSDRSSDLLEKQLRDLALKVKRQGELLGNHEAKKSDMKKAMTDLGSETRDTRYWYDTRDADLDTRYWYDTRDADRDARYWYDTRDTHGDGDRDARYWYDTRDADRDARYWYDTRDAE